MLSVSLIPPTLDFTPHPPHRVPPMSRLHPPSPGANNANHNLQHARQLQQRRDEVRELHNSRSPINLLAADESAIAARKAAIRNFGACWIRPLGVSKTLQAMNEEEAERVELNEQVRQRAGSRDLRARQQVLEAQERAGQNHAAEGEYQEEREIDVDEEMPDSPEAGTDVHFDEVSMLEGSSLFDDAQQRIELREEEEEVRQAVELEEAELTGVARDEEDLRLERDLDDSVPEAVRLQHTDFDSELQGSFVIWSMRRLARIEWSAQAMHAGGSDRPLQAQLQEMGGLQERMRAQVSAADALPRSSGNLPLSNLVLESSFVGSSRVTQRSGHARRARSRRRGRQAERAPQAFGVTAVWR